MHKARGWRIAAAESCTGGWVAQLVLREAQVEAERNMEFARAELTRMEDQIASLDRTRRSFIAQMRATAERQLAELAAAEDNAPARLNYPGSGGAEQG